ncbi:hypothetical protein ABVT39_007405 [Epinephelus coioides]
MTCYKHIATGSMQNVVGDTIQAHKSTVCRAVRRVALALCGHLNNYVQLPSGARQDVVRQKYHNIGGFPDVVGCVDGTHVKIKAPSDHENAYVNRKGFHSLNAQLVCDPDLILTNCVIKWPGCKHDSFILRQSSIYTDFEEGRATGMLLGDLGYPLKRWLMTPYINADTLPKRRYNEAHSKTHNVIERCIEVLKRRWACLHKGQLPFRHKYLVISYKIIVHCSLIINCF